MRFEPDAQVQIPAIHRIGDDPGEGNPRFPQAFNHQLGQLTLRLKARLFGNPCLPTALRIVKLFFGQIQFAINEGMSSYAHIAQKDANLTVFHSAGRSTILLFDAC
jgi:hypothetical protein